MNTRRALLDENLPTQLKALFSGALQVFTVADMGWQSKHNGEVLVAMQSEGLEFLITADRNFQYQQNIAKYSVRLVVVRSHDNRLKTLRSCVPQIEAAMLAAANDATVIVVDLR